MSGVNWDGGQWTTADERVAIRLWIDMACDMRLV